MAELRGAGWGGQPADRAGCEVAVVIPAFCQPGLLVEAVCSVLAQLSAPDQNVPNRHAPDRRAPDRHVSDWRVPDWRVPDWRIVLVDDGCPMPDTAAVTRRLARAHPDRIVLLRQANRGLSAARNVGAEFALAAWPGCRAVFFLDADNRLLPSALARAMAALRGAPAAQGWFYPDLDIFGVPGSWSVAGPYSVLQHLAENHCEAGSLVRREVFEAGIRFNEAMRQGFEDWDFWLAAAAAGFRGQHVPRLGFRYRRRKDSMVRQAERDRVAILHGMRARHGAAFGPRRLLALEASEAPRFAIHESPKEASGGAVRLAADPVDPDSPRLSADAARQAWLGAEAAPAGLHFPPIRCFAAAGALEALREARLLRSVFWLAAGRLRDRPAMLVRLVRLVPAAAGVLGMRRAGTGLAGDPAALLFLRSAALTPGLAALPAEILEVAAGDGLADPYAVLPGGIDPSGIDPNGIDAADGPAWPAPAALTAAADQPLASALAEAAALAASPRPAPSGWRPDGRRPLSEAPEAAARAWWGFGALLPCLPVRGVRDFGFVLPLCGMGGVERVIFAYARLLRAAGWRVHLFVTGAEQALLPPDARGLFETVNFAPGFDAEQRDGGVTAYLGAATSSLPEAAPEANTLPDLLGLLAGMDAVLTAHNFAGHALAGLLRGLGIPVFLGLHVQERGPWGEPDGNPQIALAYEHAYAGFVVVSQALRRWCIGQGVPAAKLIVVPNGPGYASTPSRIAAALAGRRFRAARPPGVLRVLFMGRLDAQKGLGRLAALVARGDPGIEWRVVGASVLDAPAAALARCGVTPEPPAQDPAALDALYAWADVLVLPSRFEGLPLAILEAQRLSCVVATAVGAVPEAVADDRTGLLIRAARDDGGVVEEFAAALRRLAGDPALLLRLGMAGAAQAAAAGWEQHAAPWLAELDRLCPPWREELAEVATP